MKLFGLILKRIAKANKEANDIKKELLELRYKQKQIRKTASTITATWARAPATTYKGKECK